MKVLRYIFNDHYKGSSDFFRKSIGLYWDIYNNSLSSYSNPVKEIRLGSIFTFSKPELVDDEKGLFKQEVQFLPRNTETNKLYLQSLVNISNDPEAPELVGTVQSHIEDTINDDGTKIYKDYNCLTYKVRRKTSSQDDYISLDAKYNFFIKDYENKIANELVPEEVLPNYYVVSLALNRSVLDSITQEDYNANLATGNDSPYENFYSKFDRFITLEDNLLLNPQFQQTILFGIVLVGYCQQYADVYDNVSVDYIETAKKRFSNFLAHFSNKELVAKLNEFKNSYPMYINIEWTTTTLSPLLTFLENAGISLKAFQDFVNEKLVIDTLPGRTGGALVLTNFTEIENIQDGTGLTQSTAQHLLYNIQDYLNEFLDSLLNNTVNAIPENPTSFPPAGTPEVANPGIPTNIPLLSPEPNTVVINDGVDRTPRSNRNDANKDTLPPEPNTVVIDNGADRTPRTNRHDSDLSVINMSNEFAEISNLIEDEMRIRDLLTALAAKPKLQELLETNIRTYEDIINGELSKTEILFFKIEKRQVSDNSLIQSFYLANINGIDILNYVDTQVKYNKEYRYKIHAYIAIYGTEYYYKKDITEIASEPNTITFGDQLSDIDNTVEIAPEIASEPNTVVIQGQQQNPFFNNSPSAPNLPGSNVPSANPFSNVPVQPANTGIGIDVKDLRRISDFNNLLDPFNTDFNQTNITDVNPNADIPITNIEDVSGHESSITDLDNILDTGFKFNVFFYPVIKLIELDYSDYYVAKVLNDPPTPPVADFYPIKDCSKKFKIALSPSSGELRDFPKSITTEDDIYFQSLLEQRHSEDGKISFKFEGDIKSYEVYRTTVAPISYRSFFDDTTTDRLTTIENVENILFDETVEPNTDYFYTFRTIDFHGERSNPSPVYKINLYSNDGIEFLNVSTYEFPIKEKIVSKFFKKFIRINTSFEHRTFNILDNKLGLLDESVYDNEFLLRIKSKHTGKYVDLVFKFKKQDII